MLSFDEGNFPTADFIIVTSDKVSLHVHRSILEVASPVFAGMLSLPQPQQEPGTSTTPAHTDVQEDAFTMRRVLSLIYPCPASSDKESLQPADIAVLAVLLNASIKYEFQVAIDKLALVLAELARGSQKIEDVIRIYAIGCIFDLKCLKKVASAATLRFSSSLLSRSHELSIAQPTAAPSSHKGQKRRRCGSLPSQANLDKTDELNRLLQQFGAADWFKLLRYHETTENQIHKIIAQVPPRGGCPQCGSSDWAKFMAYGLDWSIHKVGPDTEGLLAFENLRDQTSMPCDECREQSDFLHTDYLTWIHELEKAFKSQAVGRGGVDSLDPAHEEMVE